MSNSVAETIIGAVVIATAAGFAIYAGALNGTSGMSAGVPLLANFRSADGITIGTDVRMAGIKVGTVTDLALDTETYQARMTFTVRDDVSIPEDSDVKIASEGLLGGAFVEITPGASEFTLSSGDEIVNTQGSVSLLNLLMRFGASQ